MCESEERRGRCYGLEQRASRLHLYILTSSPQPANFFDGVKSSSHHLATRTAVALGALILDNATRDAFTMAMHHGFTVVTGSRDVTKRELYAEVLPLFNVSEPRGSRASSGASAARSRVWRLVVVASRPHGLTAICSDAVAASLFVWRGARSQHAAARSTFSSRKGTKKGRSQREALLQYRDLSKAKHSISPLFSPPICELHLVARDIHLPADFLSSRPCLVCSTGQAERQQGGPRSFAPSSPRLIGTTSLARSGEDRVSQRRRGQSSWEGRRAGSTG